MTKKNILICPLEWGLGHAGRMIPVARYLQGLNQNVFFGTGEEHLSFLKNEVPGAVYINFPGFRINYSRYFPQYLVILLKSPLLLFHIIREHQLLKKIINNYSIDIVISDSRIGLWNKGVKTVFVTHQVRIPFPEPLRFLEFIGKQLIRSVSKRFSLFFIPDLEANLNLSGSLSHGFALPANARYIGILSRFNVSHNESYAPSDRCTVILSGPEPQRSMLKQKLTNILIPMGKPSVFLEGRPENGYEPIKSNNILYYNHLQENRTRELLLESDLIITRSGYTTIMELVSLGISALLVPTPGQTEQEYLAEYLSQRGWFTSVAQKDLDRKHFAPACVKTEFIEIVAASRKLLHTALIELIEN